MAVVNSPPAKRVINKLFCQMTAARIGIGGPVGSGKTALIEQLLDNFKKNQLASR